MLLMFFCAIIRTKLRSLLNYLNPRNSLEMNQYLLAKCYSTLLIQHRETPYNENFYQNCILSNI